MANAHFKIGGTTVEVLASRAEQLSQTLALYSWRTGQELSERIGAHVADGEASEQVFELDDEVERRDLLAAVERHLAAAESPSADLLALRDALRASLD